uniref:NADH dehydrogenase subunit 6 n=1 Tax=Cloacotaenia megalops TaxID=576527 RepID=A0A1L2FZD5_9CEST|nr:NADH dehydrogenase subunit 6 [Cloacotaenia megalops]AOG66043.1 NADH dehydrogenase subunit 6 [Cloacotaenia megalops]
MLVNFMLFFCYFIGLICFCFLSHPVYYCGFLVLNSLVCGGICYSFFGFSWYSLLLCLVYIGGVYILFIFVSVFSPNISKVNSSLSISLLILFVIMVSGVLASFLSLDYEFSSYLCTCSEGIFYVVMCMTLLFGFLVLSIVMSVKINFYR